MPRAIDTHMVTMRHRTAHQTVCRCATNDDNAKIIYITKSSSSGSGSSSSRVGTCAAHNSTPYADTVHRFNHMQTAKLCKYDDDEMGERKNGGDM